MYKVLHLTHIKTYNSVSSYFKKLVAHVFFSTLVLNFM